MCLTSLCAQVILAIGVGGDGTASPGAESSMRRVGGNIFCTEEFPGWYFLGASDYNDALYRWAIDEPARQVSPDGSLGWPHVNSLFWNPVTQTLYGADSELGTLLKIDTQTGVGFPIGVYDLAIDSSRLAWYPPLQKFIYPKGEEIRTYDPETQTSGPLARSLYSKFEALAYVRDGAAHLNGILACDDNAIVFLPEPNHHRMLIALGCQGEHWITSADHFEVFAHHGAFSVVDRINKVSGTREYMCQISSGFSSSALVLVAPHEPPPPEVCHYNDADFDQDVDLSDWANFQNCFNGPR